MQYPLLVLVGGWLFVQGLLVGGYFVALAAMERRGDVARVWLTSALASLVAFGLFISVRSGCHECLPVPSVAMCEHSNNAIDVTIESNRLHGYIKEREFAGCYFYWHEANSGGN
jgi:hypothetical protein